MNLGCRKKTNGSNAHERTQKCFQVFGEQITQAEAPFYSKGLSPRQMYIEFQFKYALLPLVH